MTSPSVFKVTNVNRTAEWRRVWLSQCVCVLCNVLCKYSINYEGIYRPIYAIVTQTKTLRIWSQYSDTSANEDN